MIRARNQSGFAPAGVVEVELGSLRVGQRFRLWSDAERNRYQDGEVIRRSECSVRVAVVGDNVPVEFEALNKETGEWEVKRIVRSGRREENWAPSTPVEFVPKEEQHGTTEMQ
jgi:hypothetical protein